MRGARPDGDLLALFGLAVLAVARLLPDLLGGTSPYWGDLTYLHMPWRAYDAELLAAGRLPLWNPFIYFGMPQAATMQDGLYYPGTVPFFLFGFPAALAAHHLIHYWLAAALAYLWLRCAALARPAAFCGAAVVAFSGLLLAREPFVNHLAVLALMPALALFMRSAALLALALALAFFAGYPPFLAGAAASVWALALASSSRPAQVLRDGGRAWTAGGVLSVALGACLLLPAAELVGLSRRAAGMATEETLAYGFSPADLLRWLSPWLNGVFNPAVDWTRCCYLGLAAAGLAAAGLAALPRRKAAGLALLVCGVVVLTLGGSNSFSAWLWGHLPPLRFIRYPGNTAYLALLPLAALAAAGVQRLRGRLRLLACAAVCAELAVYAWGAMPRHDKELLVSKGPLAARLQEELGGRRYLLSPLALQASAGVSPLDWRWRLYGLTNAPLKLRAAANFGEPLTPRPNYALMDELFRAAGPASIMPLLPWLDVGALLTPPKEGLGRQPPGEPLWTIRRVEDAAGARLLSTPDGDGLPQSVSVPARLGTPLAVERRREDAFTVRGEGAGWVFAAEPLYPGWTLWLETPRGPGLSRALPALGPFQKTAVPAGPWVLHWLYQPASFFNGLLLSLAAAGLLCAYWYNRARTLPS